MGTAGVVHAAVYVHVGHLSPQEDTDRRFLFSLLSHWAEIGILARPVRHAEKGFISLFDSVLMFCWEAVSMMRCTR